MSLLHDVLKPKDGAAVDQIAAKLNELRPPSSSPRAQSPSFESGTSDEDDYVDVVSVPGTPRRLNSRVASRTQSRSTSPTRHGGRSGAPSGTSTPNTGSRLAFTPTSTPASDARTSRLANGLSASSGTERKSSKAPKSKTDPVRVLPTDLIQRVFGELEPADLARASRVCLKWNKSQSLNYLWFQEYRRAELGDETVPVGKWTRRESKENWRKAYMKQKRVLQESELTGSSRYGYGYATPSGGGSLSGYNTPSRQNAIERQQAQEQRWAEEEAVSTSKNEMRGMYKELGGRKSKSKNERKVGGGGGLDKGGWAAADEE